MPDRSQPLVHQSDEFSWKDRDACHGRVIGHRENCTFWGKIGRDAGVRGVENAQVHLRALLKLGLVQREWKSAEHGMAAGYCYRRPMKARRC